MHYPYANELKPFECRHYNGFNYSREAQGNRSTTPPIKIKLIRSAAPAARLRYN